VKKYCKNIYAGGTPDSNNMDYWEEGNIPWLPSGMCRDSEIYEANKFITQLGFENSSTKIIPAYTTIMAMTGATCGNMGFVTFETCANQSVVAYVSENNSFPKYLFYALLSAREYILTFQTGGAQAGINVQNCKNFIIPFIDIEEQQKIAEFLDRKCGEIDELLALQEKMIEELKAYKQSIITEAVTKGLNPNVAMRDSEIEWIGEIPEHWEVYRIKYNTFLKGRIGWQGLNSNDFIEEGYCLITGTDFDNKGGINWNTCYRISKERFNEDELLHIKNGDLLMTKDGTVGKMAYIQNLPEEASLNSHLLIIRQTTDIISNKFLYWVMLSNVFKHFCLIHQSGSIMNSISQSTLGILSCCCPTLTEQKEIADYLDRKCDEIDRLIEIKGRKIEKLKEYKKSLIYEYVTGKKEI
jgi:type I restriction enzyme S subunit